MSEKRRARRPSSPHQQWDVERGFHPNTQFVLANCLETHEVRFEVWTTRAILAGEELTIDYGYDWGLQLEWTSALRGPKWEHNVTLQAQYRASVAERSRKAAEDALKAQGRPTCCERGPPNTTPKQPSRQTAPLPPPPAPTDDEFGPELR